MIPERWQAYEAVYRTAQAPARFRTFESVGHGTNRLVHQACVTFIPEVTGTSRPA